MRPFLYFRTVPDVKVVCLTLVCPQPARRAMAMRRVSSGRLRRHFQIIDLRTLTTV